MPWLPRIDKPAAMMTPDGQHTDTSRDEFQPRPFAGRGEVRQNRVEHRRAPLIMAEELTPHNFRPHLNKTFRVVDGHHALELTAIEQPRQDLHDTEGGLRQPFNLV